jgi:hypothetical protein
MDKWLAVCRDDAIGVLERGGCVMGRYVQLLIIRDGHDASCIDTLKREKITAELETSLDIVGLSAPLCGEISREHKRLLIPTELHWLCRGRFLSSIYEIWSGFILLLSNMKHF